MPSVGVPHLVQLESQLVREPLQRLILQVPGITLYDRRKRAFSRLVSRSLTSARASELDERERERLYSDGRDSSIRGAASARHNRSTPTGARTRGRSRRNILSWVSTERRVRERDINTRSRREKSLHGHYALELKLISRSERGVSRCNLHGTQSWQHDVAPLVDRRSSGSIWRVAQPKFISHNSGGDRTNKSEGIQSYGEGKINGLKIWCCDVSVLISNLGSCNSLLEHIYYMNGGFGMANGVEESF